MKAVTKLLMKTARSTLNLLLLLPKFSLISSILLEARSPFPHRSAIAPNIMLQSPQTNQQRLKLMEKLEHSDIQTQHSLEETFLELAETWRHDTEMLSSPTKKLKHPAYQKIISIGKPVLPLILRELERQPDRWFMALSAIAKQDPVSPEDNFKQAVEAWLQWGREQKLI